MVRRRRTAARLAALVCASLAGALAGCRPAAEPAPPAIVLLTLEGLRADVSARQGGPPGLTPHLDRFAGEADWAGRAVASSGAPGAALVSLLTGLAPHQHGAWGTRPRMRDELESLAEALAGESYRTASYREGNLVRRQPALGQGFDVFAPAERREAVLAALRTLRPSRDFVWLHSSLPGGQTLVLRDRFRDRLPAPPPGLPRRLRQGARAGEEAGPVDDAARRALYLSNVAQADLEVGHLLGELREHGPWDRTLVVVVGVTGWSPQSSRERDPGLERSQLEVPLWIKLPRASSRRLWPAQTARVAASRLYATLVEAGGAAAVPAAAASLFAPGEDDGALSARLAANGVNEFSLVRGDLRLLRRVRFAPEEPEYAAARTRRANRAAPRTSESPRLILRRLDRAFARTPPYSGGQATLELERWTADGGAEPIADAAAMAALAQQMDRAFFAFLDEERAPQDEDRR